MKDRRQIYTAQISPLIDQIIAICECYGMPMFAEVQFSPEQFYRTFYPGQKTHPLLFYHDALSKCSTGGGVNVDQFIRWVAGEAQIKGHRSTFLYQLGIPAEPAREVNGE